MWGKKVLWSLTVAVLGILLSAGLVYSQDPDELGSSTVERLNEIGAPKDLREWRDWVLYGEESSLCPTVYNNDQTYYCAWPSRLTLSLEDEGGRFRQEWLVQADTWAPLPGGQAAWPEKVMLDNEPVPVMDRGGVPSVSLAPGRHVIEGVFSWLEIPEMIEVPPASGLVDLTVHGRSVQFPVLDENGRLWLQKKAVVQSEEDRLSLRIFRLLDDDIPMKVTSLLKINVSGRAREETLKNVMLPKSVPLSLSSQLPVWLGPDGELKIQARPGQWEIELVSRFEGPIDSLGPTAAPYGREIWSFKPENHLRMVKVEGLNAVDPNQTDVPDDWKSYSTYIIDPEAVMKFVTLRRGDPDPAPDRLNLKRTWWLDFDGRGYTVKDQITGTMSREWRLSMNPPGVLGRVSVDGLDQLITVSEDNKPGVELRQGRLELNADSRLEENLKRIPAVGWDHDFQSVSAELKLPPGWRLLAAQGVDLVPGTWFERWSLLDLFLVLIITIAIFKLTSWKWGLLALVTLTLTYHEVGAPRLVWLHLLGATALLRVLPEGWFRTLARLWRLAAVVALLVFAIPFILVQARQGLYPQLENMKGYIDYLGKDRYMLSADFEDDAATVRPEVPGRYKSAPPLPKLKSARPSEEPQVQQEIQMQTNMPAQSLDAYDNKQVLRAQDPKALIQTGPGLPTWDWRTIRLTWNGPVDRGQEVRLYLTSPLANSILSFIRVILMAVLVVSLIDLRRWRPLLTQKTAPVAAAVLALGLLLPAQPQASGYPPPEIMDELKARLLEPADCLPYCAQYPRMRLTANPEEIRITLEIHAAADTAVPLPGQADSWLPRQVYFDGQDAAGLLRDVNGVLWLLCPTGIHTVTLLGPPPGGNSFQIPFTLRPIQVEVDSDGWGIDGLRRDGRVESSLQLTWLKKEATEKEEPTGPTALPPFLHVERVISLGLTWQVFTTVTRVSPPGTPVVVSVPLLPGESVITAGIHVENGQVLVNMDPLSRQLTWTSTLNIAPAIDLLAPDRKPWTETWILDASPIWHCQTSGIPVVHHQDAEGHWRPEWRPWPGEKVHIAVTRPEALPGRTMTIDQAVLKYTLGKRFNKAALTLKIRSSQGGQHRIVLPETARLQLVKINGRSQPIGQEGREVVIPLQPGGGAAGAQTVDIEWNEPAGSMAWAKGPEVKIGDQAVNSKVAITLPANRWVLWTAGPRLGPAVLFWTYLIVVFLAALGLGRIKGTPLKTRHWFLLGLGLTQIHHLLAIVIVGWLLILRWRAGRKVPEGWFLFDLSQLGLIVWTIVALIGLYVAVERGLLGIPQMWIASAQADFQAEPIFYWYQDHIGASLPRPLVVSLPRLVFHGIMLVWALWLALSLIKWLRWGWEAFTQGALMKKPPWQWKKKTNEDFIIE